MFGAWRSIDCNKKLYYASGCVVRHGIEHSANRNRIFYFITFQLAEKSEGQLLAKKHCVRTCL